MDLGERIEYGMRQMEVCIICRRNVAMGETLKPFHCGRVAHAFCVTDELRNRRERKEAIRKRVEEARKRQEDGEEVDEKELTEVDVDMNIVCRCTHRISRLNTPLRIPEPPPLPLPHVIPHVGYPLQQHRLCGICSSGWEDFEKLVHPNCGLVVCGSCFEDRATRRIICEECGQSLSSCKPLRIDPRELEDLVHQNQH